MPTWKTLDEAAKQSGVSRRQIQRWIAEERLVGYKAPGDRHLYVDMNALAKFRKYQPLPPRRRRLARKPS